MVVHLLGYTWDSENNMFWQPQPYASWVKNTTTASWDSPVGAAPTISSEQRSQNEAGTHLWNVQWNEETTSWETVDTLV